LKSRGLSWHGGVLASQTFSKSVVVPSFFCRTSGEGELVKEILARPSQSMALLRWLLTERRVESLGRWREGASTFV
jgi:hypothetical protein